MSAPYRALFYFRRRHGRITFSMSLTKFASFEVSEVLDIKSSASKSKTASLRTLSDFHDYRTDDGYLYVRIRAISSRVNKNHDGWPTAELAGGPDAWERISSQHQASEGGFRIEADTAQEYGFPTFIGKPIFVDHNNSDPKRARGVIVDSAFNVLDQHTAAEGDEYWGSDDVDPEHFPPAEVELLLEVDADQFPKFAKQIVDGDLDGFSMGCDVDYSKCSHCGHEASNPNEYCSHIVMKGAEHTFESGKKAGRTGRSYENCYGIKFFEISGVFEPADETALAKEVVASKVATLEKEADDLDGIYNTGPLKSREMRCPYCSGVGCEKCGNQGSVDVGAGGDGPYVPEQQPLMGQPVAGPDIHVPPGFEHLHQGIYGPEIHGPNGEIDVPHLTLPAEELRRKFKLPSTPVQGNYLAARTAAIKEADNPEPQSMHTKAPEDVNTLRQERVCPLCGSDMDADKCDVCGYEEPPESLQNPDLGQAHDVDLTQQDQDEVTIPNENEPAPPDNGTPQPEGESYLNARNNQPTASVTSDMRWAPREITAADKPQGDEPIETVTSDQTTPVTSAFRTAKQMIAAAAAKRNQENNQMSDQTKVAADPADPSGKAKKRVDVEGVGGVDEASAEAASKADAQVDVEGKGGVIQDSNEEASKPDEKQSVEETSDNAGFDQGHRTDDSGPTKTFDNSNEPGSAVTDKAFPTSAKKGTDPADPSGKADERINVEEPPHDRVGPGTDQWTGTNGNGVTKQQDPVTNKPTQSGGITSGLISLAAIALVETEVELGITSKDNKLNRLASLASVSEEEIKAEHRALGKVKKAGLTRTASRSQGLPVGRVPSFNRIASSEPVAPQPVDDALLDSAMFGR